MPDVLDGLAGEQLREQLYLAHAAVQNWSRLTHGPDNLHDARFALLDTIVEHGRAQTVPPAWMTSPKPGVVGYVPLPGDAVLLLVPDERNGRGYLAGNCVAPRRRANRKQTTHAQPKALSKARLDAGQLAAALALSAEQLEQTTWLSVHCVERFAQRAAELGDNADAADTLRALIAATGRVVAPAPSWADAAGQGGAVILCGTDGDLIALPLAPDRSGRPQQLVASTCLPKAWVDADLTDRTGPELAAAVHLTSRAAEQYAEAHRLDADRARVELAQLIADSGRGSFDPPAGADPGVYLLIDGGYLRLRPATAAQRHNSAASWFAMSYTADGQASGK